MVYASCCVIYIISASPIKARTVCSCDLVRARRHALLCEYEERRKTVMKRRMFLLWNHAEEHFRGAQHYHQRALKHRCVWKWQKTQLFISGHCHPKQLRSSNKGITQKKNYIQCPPLILAPLVNMSKGGCENKSALFILFIFYSKNSQNSNLSLK